MHEIITLQFGQRANYLATHFWNTQESYFTYAGEVESPVDHDILFRPGVGADGTETFTPRALIYDLKGGFGNLRKINALYELEEDKNPQGLWNGPTVVQRQTAIEQTAYQMSLDEGLEAPLLTSSSVRYWSDFNRVYFHPKSIIQLNEYELNSSLVPFERWDTGEELFTSLDKEHDLLDRDVRSFAEEADQLQGLQIFTSVDDAWGGFAASYVDRLRDEYGKTAIWVWGLEDSLRSIPRAQQAMKLSNSARSLSSISPQASLYIPLSPPSSLPAYISLESNSPWHMSALFSTAVESMTLPSRLKSAANRETLDTLAAALNINGKQNIAKLQMSLIPESPHSGNGNNSSASGIAGDNRLPSHLRLRENGNGHSNSIHSSSAAEDYSDEDSAPESLDVDFFPSSPPTAGRQRLPTKKLHTFGQAETYRGDLDSNNTSNENDYDGHNRAIRRAAGLPILHQCAPTPLGFPLLSSFPAEIFDNELTIPASTTNHDNDSGQTVTAARKHLTVRIQTRLSTDTSVAARIKGLRDVQRLVGLEEREALGNVLGELAEGYEEGWDEGSDSGDDDY